MEVEDINWYFFEAMECEINHLSLLGVFEDSGIEDEAAEICRLTMETGKFSTELKERVIKVAAALDFYREEGVRFAKQRAKEHKEDMLLWN